MKIYNVVVSVSDDGNNVYNAVRSFRTFGGAVSCLRGEYEKVKNDVFGSADCDKVDFDVEEDNEIAWFDLQVYDWNLYASGSVFVCELED